MLGALIIVFREVIEAGLIVGIVMAATRGVPDRSRWIMIGIGAGVLGAAIVAMFAGVISEAFQGAGQELFNASVLGVAVIMLMWHNAWMARHGREIADEMRRVGTAVSEGAKPLTALAIVVGLAVLREGSEVVLFLYGILASGTTVSSLLTGGLRGIQRPDLFRPAGNPEPIYLLGDELAHRPACRRYGGSIRPVSEQCWSRDSARPHGLGYVLVVVRRKHLRAPSAHADRLYRTADRNAARGLCLHSDRDVRADAGRALFAAPQRPGRRRIAGQRLLPPSVAKATSGA